MEVTQCESCEERSETATDYCPNCGAGPDPWESVERFDFERDADLPIIFDMVGGSEWRAWYMVAEEIWGRRLPWGDVKNLPADYRRLFKYNRSRVYYKLDEDCEIHGPFLDESEAREA